MRYQRIFLVALLFGAASCGPSFDLSNEPTPTTRTEYVQFVAEHAPSEDAFVAVQRLAFESIEHHNWLAAIDTFRAYEPMFPAMHGRFDTIIALLEAPDDTVRMRSLGDSINTAGYDEFLPVVTVDGKKLYFCRDIPGTNDDVMVATRLGDTGSNQWSQAHHVPPPIFTTQSEAPTGVSADGNTLLLFGNYLSTKDSFVVRDSGRLGSLAKANLFYCDKQPDGSWGPVKPFPFPINSGYYESDAKLSSDGKELFFVSDRPGGIGGFHPKLRVQGTEQLYHGSLWGNTDIYVSVRKPDGSWGAPINLGPTINTPYAERTPFLHPDGKTLYFSSEGHPGLGMLDIYKSTRLSDSSWTKWSTPVDLGKSINTGGADWGYMISTDGSTAYKSVSNRAMHEYDIKSMTLPRAVRPEYVATITGFVTDDKGNPLSASIKWDDLETGANVGALSSDPTDGSFFITLPLNKNYGYYAEKAGYFPVSRSIDLRGIDTAVHDTVNIVLLSIKTLQASDTAIRLNNIFFDFDKATLKPESFPELTRLLDILEVTPDVHVEIDAHTDNKGTHAYNVSLSKRRAQSVVDWLIEHGIHANRLLARGFAETRPIATNETDEGRALNRRVEFRFPRDSEVEDLSDPASTEVEPAVPPATAVSLQTGK